MSCNTNRPRKNNIWSDTLLEENLCSDIGKFSSILCDDENAIKVENRDVESYQYTIDDVKKSSSVKDKRNHLTIDSSLVNFTKNIESKAKPDIPVKNRLGSLVSYDENKSRVHIAVSEIDNEATVAKVIAKHLREDKTELICKLTIDCRTL